MSCVQQRHVLGVMIIAIPTYRYQKLLVKFRNKPDICICKIDTSQQQSCDLDIFFDDDDVESAPILISDVGEWDVTGKRHPSKSVLVDAIPTSNSDISVDVELSYCC